MKDIGKKFDAAIDTIVMGWNTEEDTKVAKAQKVAEERLRGKPVDCEITNLTDLLQETPALINEVDPWRRSLLKFALSGTITEKTVMTVAILLKYGANLEDKRGGRKTPREIIQNMPDSKLKREFLNVISDYQEESRTWRDRVSPKNSNNISSVNASQNAIQNILEQHQPSNNVERVNDMRNFDIKHDR